jgi:hypothetical protein
MDDPLQSVVDGSTVGDSCHVERANTVVDFVDDAVVTDANAPFPVSAFEFPAAGRTRVCCQALETRHEPGDEGPCQPLQLPLGARRERDAVLSHEGVCRSSRAGSSRWQGALAVRADATARRGDRLCPPRVPGAVECRSAPPPCAPSRRSRTECRWSSPAPFNQSNRSRVTFNPNARERDVAETSARDHGHEPGTTYSFPGAIVRG